MAVKYTTEAFVFKKEDRLDADRIFSVFTKDFGRLEVFGKALRRIDSKLKSAIEIFSFSQIEFIQGKNKKTLTDALPLGARRAMLGDPEKFETAAKISAVMDVFLKGQEPDEKVWAGIADIFGKLSTEGINNKLLYYYFFWNFISLLGYGPELSVCASCRQTLQPQALYFSYGDGGLLCQACAVKKPQGRIINADAVKVLRLMVQKEWDLLQKLKMGPQSKSMVKQISDGYYNYVTAASHSAYEN